MLASSAWYELDYHETQARFFWDDVRFKMSAAGRRSGKTIIMKREGSIKARDTKLPDFWGVFAAPTHAQAKLIFWHDLKAMVPRDRMARPPRETDLSIRLKNGAELQVVGMDKPERIEGRPLDWIVLDEYGNMKDTAWTEHVRPALSTRGRPGEARFIGVPEGRNHYWDLWCTARLDKTDNWATYHWLSSEIIDPEEIEQARREMDERTFSQEYEGNFLDFVGRVYYTFDVDTHCKPLKYYPEKELVLCFDFNKAPGVALICQEIGGQTHCISEIWKETDSNTEIICKMILREWGDHNGPVCAYGDATGGAAGTQAIRGSDWAIIRQMLPERWKDMMFEVPKANTKIVPRTNSVNSRLRSSDSTVSMYVDPDRCPHLVKDLEGVTYEELEKKEGSLTHISDALGYYIVRSFPMQPYAASAEPM